MATVRLLSIILEREYLHKCHFSPGDGGDSVLALVFGNRCSDGTPLAFQNGHSDGMLFEQAAVGKVDRSGGWSAGGVSCLRVLGWVGRWS